MQVWSGHMVAEEQTYHASSAETGLHVCIPGHAQALLAKTISCAEGQCKDLVLMPVHAHAQWEAGISGSKPDLVCLCQLLHVLASIPKLACSAGIGEAHKQTHKCVAMLEQQGMRKKRHRSGAHTRGEVRGWATNGARSWHHCSRQHDWGEGGGDNGATMVQQIRVTPCARTQTPSHARCNHPEPAVQLLLSPVTHPQRCPSLQSAAARRAPCRAA